MMHRRLPSLLALSLLIAIPAIAAPVGRELRQRSLPRRVVAVSDDASSASIRLENGETVSVPHDDLRIMRVTDAKTAEAVSPADLSAHPLPAVARVVYRRDGSVRRVVIRVFDSDDDAAKFLRRFSPGQ